MTNPGGIFGGLLRLQSGTARLALHIDTRVEIRPTAVHRAFRKPNDRRHSERI
jgi:hypothetical protein